jgi:MerR family transcriptional regulator, copper efflux regulator
MLIGEVAKMTNLSKDGIRHYEALGLVVSTPRVAGSRVYRDYDISVPKRVEQIRQMQQLGFELKEMKPILDAYEASGPIPKETVIAFLQDRLKVIRGKIDELRIVEESIRNKLDGYLADVAAADCSPKAAPLKRHRQAGSVS